MAPLRIAMCSSLVAAICWQGHAALADPASGATAEGVEVGPRGVIERDVVYVDPPPGTQVTRVIVDNRLGNVRIEGYDQPGVTVLAEKRATNAATLDRLKVTLVPDPGGPIRIATALLPGEGARPIAAGSAGIDIVIRAPRAALAEAQAWKGRVMVMGMDGGARLSTNEGDIIVHNVAGKVVTHVARGDQEIKNVFGALDAEGLIGDLALASVSGDRLSAALHRGTITARDIHVKVAKLQVFSGNIDLVADVMLGGRYKIQSYNGDIRVRVRGSGPVAVMAFSREGRVTVGKRLAPRQTPADVVIGRRGPSRRASSWELSSRMGNIRFAVLAD